MSLKCSPKTWCIAFRSSVSYPLLLWEPRRISTLGHDFSICTYSPCAAQNNLSVNLPVNTEVISFVNQLTLPNNSEGGLVWSVIITTAFSESSLWDRMTAGGRITVNAYRMRSLSENAKCFSLIYWNSWHGVLVSMKLAYWLHSISSFHPTTTLSLTLSLL